jgi:pimeloyl-ACP methyl ester carboxylesterase
VSQTYRRISLRVPEPTASVRAGRGEPLLLIHPFMLSHEVWSDVVPVLAQEHDVVAATLPGHWGGPHLRRGGIRDLDHIDVPVRVVLCQDDWLLPPERHGAMFRDQLPDPDVVELAGVGHVPMYDDPAAVARLVAEHVGLWRGSAGESENVPA